MNNRVLRVGVELDLDTRIRRASLAWLGRVFIDLGDGRRLRAQEPAIGGSFEVFFGTRRVRREEIEQAVPRALSSGRAARQVRDLPCPGGRRGG